jgi:glycosyltransferase involved in cell wall biosynthesis
MTQSLHIGLVSYEFPPAVAIGGIGTYAWNAARMLAAGGHHVEVFAAGPAASPIQSEPASAHGVRVHRIAAPDRACFRKAVVKPFAKRHQETPFDVLESPEIGAEAVELIQRFPQLPLVVKLHTSTQLLAHLGGERPFWRKRLRYAAGALRRGRWAWLSPPHKGPDQVLERQFTLKAHAIAAPSEAIARAVQRDWGVSVGGCDVFPLPYAPDPALLELPVPRRLDTIGFIGRLETRKGIYELAGAMLPLLQRHPDLQLRLIGPSWPTERGDSRSWLEGFLAPVLHQVVFTGPVSPDAIAEHLAHCSAVVLPSRWESFGLVCAESMAAARLVIGSAAGGMADMIEPGVSGFLVPPRSPGAIRRVLQRLLERPECIASVAATARRRILELLDPAQVLPLQLASYSRAIERARAGATPC